MSAPSHFRKKVSYFYNSEVGKYYYGQGHPMKPHRIRMTHDLIMNYGLFTKMKIYEPNRASLKDLTNFHTSDYINFLKMITPDNVTDYYKEMQQFNVGGDDDCPVFDGLFRYCQNYAGGSISGAIKLNNKEADIVINWAGGLHHAKQSEASGFCYVNDIVLAIIELLKYHQRVLYIDIDIHHGDGVEEAFYTTDRVMTCSFHKYGENFFPGTGALRNIGREKGKYYSVNFPMQKGIDDDGYESIFVPVMTRVMELFQPNAIVLQCGADSLAEDRVGCFNLTLKGHSKCVEFVRKSNIPLLLLGGGGYTMRNVARCWTLETAVAVGTDISNDLPQNEFYEYFGPDFKLHIDPSSTMNNENSSSYLEKTKARVLQNLQNLPCVPSVPMQEIPDDAMNIEKCDDEKDAKDIH